MAYLHWEGHFRWSLLNSAEKKIFVDEGVLCYRTVTTLRPLRPREFTRSPCVRRIRKKTPLCGAQEGSNFSYQYHEVPGPAKIPTLHLDSTTAIKGWVWGLEWSGLCHHIVGYTRCLVLGWEQIPQITMKELFIFTKKLSFEKMKHHKKNIMSFLAKKSPIHCW